MAEDRRRDFIKYILGGGFALVAGSVVYPVSRFMTPPEISEGQTASVLAGSVKDMAPGSSRTFRFGTKPGLLIRADSGEFHAFIAICTHLGCIVEYRKEKKGIWCNCHNGFFDIYGNVISGPPPRPLTSLKVSIQGGEIHISRAE